MLDARARLTAATAYRGGPPLLFADAHGRPPDRSELVEASYGVSVPDLSLYVGYARPEMFDVPLLATGGEHLYATLDLSPELSER